MLNIYALQHQRKPRKLKLSPAVHKRHKKPGAKLHFHDYPPSRKKTHGETTIHGIGDAATMRWRTPQTMLAGLMRTVRVTKNPGSANENVCLSGNP